MEIEPETEGMLIENGIDYDEFPQEVLAIRTLCLIALLYCKYRYSEQIASNNDLNRSKWGSIGGLSVGV